MRSGQSQVLKVLPAALCGSCNVFVACESTRLAGKTKAYSNWSLMGLLLLFLVQKLLHENAAIPNGLSFVDTLAELREGNAKTLRNLAEVVHRDVPATLFYTYEVGSVQVNHS